MGTSTMLLGLMRTGCNVTIGIEQERHTHLVCTHLNCDELLHLPCTIASMTEPKSGNMNSWHPCDSNMDPCVVFAFVCLMNISLISDAAEFDVHLGHGRPNSILDQVEPCRTRASTYSLLSPAAEREFNCGHQPLE